MVDFDKILQKRDKGTTNISNSSHKEKKNIEEQNENKLKNTDASRQKSVAVLGGSMLKRVNGCKAYKFLIDCNPFVTCMLSIFQVHEQSVCWKPSLWEDPDHFILDAGENDLSTERSPELIARSIIDLATA